MSGYRRELFDRAGSAASDTHTIDLQLVGETIEELPRSGKRNGVEEEA